MDAWGAITDPTWTCPRPGRRCCSAVSLGPAVKASLVSLADDQLSQMRGSRSSLRKAYQLLLNAWVALPRQTRRGLLRDAICWDCLLALTGRPSLCHLREWSAGSSSCSSSCQRSGVSPSGLWTPACRTRAQLLAGHGISRRPIQDDTSGCNRCIRDSSNVFASASLCRTGTSGVKASG